MNQRQTYAIILILLSVFLISGCISNSIPNRTELEAQAAELNISLEDTAIGAKAFFEFDYNDVYPRFIQLVEAPRENPEMMWILTPLIIMILLMEFYFGRYTGEELGWNTAVGNSMVLIFVAIDLLRYVYGDQGIVRFYEGGLEGLSVINPYLLPLKTLIAVFIGMWGLMLLLMNFFHALPKKVAFFLSSTLPINITAYLGIIIVYSGDKINDIPINLTTIAAAVLLFIVVSLFFKIVHFLEPKYKPREKPQKEQH